MKEQLENGQPCYMAGVSAEIRRYERREKRFKTRRAERAVTIERKQQRRMKGRA